VVYCIGEYKGSEKVLLERSLNESLSDFHEIFSDVDANKLTKYILLNFGEKSISGFDGEKVAGKFLFVGFVELFNNQLRRNPNNNKVLSTDDYASRSKGVSLHELLHLKHYSNNFPESSMINPRDAINDWNVIYGSFKDSIKEPEKINRLVNYKKITEAIARYGSTTWYEGLNDEEDKAALKHYINYLEDYPDENAQALEAIYRLHDSATGYTGYINPSFSKREVERTVLKLIMPKIARAKSPAHLEVMCYHYSMHPEKLAEPIDWQ